MRGKRTAQILEGQLEAGLGLEPDLVTVVSGVNDALHPKGDVAAVAADLQEMFGAFSRRGACVMGCTFPIPTAGLARRVGPRLRELNARIRDAAKQEGVVLVDLEDFTVASDLRLWSADRIHLNSDGHRRLAGAAHGNQQW